MENLKKQLLLEKDKIEEILNEKLQEQSIFKYFTDKNTDECYDANDEVIIDDYQHIENFVTILFSSTSNVPYSEIKHKTRFLNDLYSRLDSNTILKVLASLSTVLEYLTVGELISLFNKEKIDIKISPKNLQIEKIPAFLEETRNFYLLTKETNFPINEVLALYAIDEDSARDSLTFGAAISKRSSIIETLFNPNSLFFNQMETLLLSVGIQAALNHTFKLYEETTDEIKRLRRKLVAYNDTIKFIDENNSKKEITNIPSSYKKLDDNFKNHLLKAIYVHNQEYYNSLEVEYKEMSEDGIRQRKILFKKFGINMDDNNMLFEKNLKELEATLEKIKILKISDSNLLLDIITNLDKEKLEYIIKQINTGYLPAKFVRENPILLKETDEDNSYDNLVKNIQTFKTNKVSKESISNDLYILLEDSDTISNNIHILKEYSYTKTINQSSSLDYLLSENLEDKIDLMLELGYENNIEADLTLLKYDVDTYRRLELLQQLNIELETNEDIKKVLESKNFIINSDDIDDYILDLSSFAKFDRDNSRTKNEFKLLLEDLKTSDESSRVLIIDDIRISKNKLDRSINSIDSDILTAKDQFNLICSTRSLNREQYDAINNIINNKDNYSLVKQKNI